MLSPKRFGRVAVVMGGWSAEREISVRSGTAVCAALRLAGIDAHPVDADRNVVTTLQAAGFARAFLLLHGRGGEDGSLQGALDLAGIPYTGSGVLGSALAMDKHRAKQVCAYNGIRTPDHRIVHSVDEAVANADALGYPVIVKPVFEGSSIGVNKAMQNEVVSAYEQASEYGEVMLESFVDGTEVTAAIIDDQALPLVSMSTPRLFYDYDAKYFADSTEYVCPWQPGTAVEQRIQASALKAFQVIGASGWGRADFLLDRNGEEYFIELNTAPGMTDHSLVPMAAQAAGIEFGELCVRILSGTLTAVALA